MKDKHYWIWLIVLLMIGTLLVILQIIYLLPDLFNKTDKSMFIITSLTLLALIWYAYETHIMVNRQIKKDLTPSVGFVLNSKIIDGKPDNKFYKAYDISLDLVSYSINETISKVFLDLYIDDIKINPISSDYNGEPSWIIPPFGQRNGHFEIDDNIVKSVNPDLVLSAVSWNPPKKLKYHYIILVKLKMDFHILPQDLDTI